MARRNELALGLDFGTESVRALLVDLTGRERAAEVVKYKHGQIVDALPATGKPLPPHWALQHPQDWLDSAARATRRALKDAGATGNQVIGIGVDFTSCTMLPTFADGTPLCLVTKWQKQLHAWPKLWKHHGAQQQTDRINDIARKRKEPWLARYGGVIGLEWFFPKMFEVLDDAPQVFDAAEVWLEAGDWFVWRLVGGDATELPRSTCQAGYKAMWNADDGYPSPNFLRALHSNFADVVKTKMPGRIIAPGAPAGALTVEMAKTLGLAAGTPVSAAIIDAHSGVPGAGVAEAGVMVSVMGTSSCHMLMSKKEVLVPGIAGVVRDGILPGYYGYETGQAAVGDAFAWVRAITGHQDFHLLTERAGTLEPGSEGVRALDWLNGCRTPLMDGALRGAFRGLALHHGAEHLYRAMLEASACGLRWIVDLLDRGGVPVNNVVATGGLPHANPFFIQVCADVLNRPIMIHPSQHGPALGAAILGALAAGSERTGFSDVGSAVHAMSAPAARGARTVKPNRNAVRAYEQVNADYHAMAGIERG